MEIIETYDLDYYINCNGKINSFEKGRDGIKSKKNVTIVGNNIENEYTAFLTLGSGGPIISYNNINDLKIKFKEALLVCFAIEGLMSFISKEDKIKMFTKYDDNI